jgi:hypothetical protein
MKYLYLACLFFALAGSLTAAEVSSHVTYVAASTVYLDAGRAQGLQVGDSGSVMRKDQPIVRIQVVFVADSSASCKIVTGDGTAVVGDAAIIHITPPPVAAPDNPVAAAQPANAVTAAPVKKTKTVKANKLSGRAGVQLYGQNSRDAGNYDSYQPAFVLRARVDRVLDAPLTLSIRLNARKQIRKTHSIYAKGDEWQNRLYELSLAYAAPESRFSYEAGRILSNHLSGIGYLDGALVDYRMGGHLSAGAFGGAEPDVQTTKIQKSSTKAGAYVRYHRTGVHSTALDATVSAVGEYRHGTINREFVYQQANYTLGSRFSAWESAEININRGWRKTMAGRSMELSNLLINLRYAPTSSIAFMAGYDNRTAYRTYETRTLADSLFDTALQQGYQAGAEITLPARIRWDVRGTLQTRRTETSSARSLSTGFASSDLLGSRISAALRLTTFTNHFSKGYQPSLSLLRNLGPVLNAGLAAGHDQYDLKSTAESVSSNWARLSTDCLFGRVVYGSAYYEINRGSDYDADRFFVETGIRF